MTGAKLTCPACDMILVTSAPMAAGTVVTCPRCRTCFGVPALETKVALAEPVVAPAEAAPAVLPAKPVPAAPPVARAQPVAAPVPAPEPDRAAAKPQPVRHQPAAPVLAPEALDFDEVDRPARLRSKPAVQHGPKEGTKDFKHRHKKKNDPMVLWLMVGSGVLLLVALGIVVAYYALPSEKKPAKGAHKEPSAAGNPVDNKKPPVQEAAGKPEKRSAAAKNAPANKGKPESADKKDKADGMTSPDDESEKPRPIPGLGSEKPAKSGTKPDDKPAPPAP